MRWVLINDVDRELKIFSNQDECKWYHSHSTTKNNEVINYLCNKSINEYKNNHYKITDFTIEINQ